MALAGVVLVLVLLAVVSRTGGTRIIHQYPRFGYGTRSPLPAPSLGGYQVAPQGDTPPWLDVIMQILMAIGVLGATALIGMIIVLVIRTLSARPSPAAAGGSEDTDTAVDLVAVDEHLARTAVALEADGDVNTVIVRCWEGLERLAREAGAARDPAQTAREFTRTVLDRATLPLEAVDRLADLYEAALFSGEPLPERARTDAVRCLDQLLAAVRVDGTPRSGWIS